MAPKVPKEPSSDADIMRTQFITKLSTAADAMRQFSNFADALARVVAKVPLDDSEVVETLQAVIDAVPAPSRKRNLGAVELTGDDSSKKRKREKKPKDPNAPKAPPSAYILFQNEVRNGVREQHPDVQYKELMGLISKQWNGLPPEMKQPYFDKVTAAKQIHEIDLAKYNASNPDFVPSEGPSKKRAKKAAEPAAKTDKRPAPTKTAKVPPKSAEIVLSSQSSESDSDSDSSSTDQKAGSDTKSSDEDDSDDDNDNEVVVAAKEPSPPPKKVRKADKRK
ncbi:HMG-box [Gyrodon lividus]|nr:HMG-box [Gyrodon lividus]